MQERIVTYPSSRLFYFYFLLRPDVLVFWTVHWFEFVFFKPCAQISRRRNVHAGEMNGGATDAYVFCSHQHRLAGQQ